MRLGGGVAGKGRGGLRVVGLIRIVSSRTVVSFPRHHDENEEEEGEKDHSHVEMPPTIST